MAHPPLGQHTNLEHPPNEAGLAYTTLGLALFTVTLFAWFRFLVKRCIMQKLHVEDCRYLVIYIVRRQMLTEGRFDSVCVGG